MSDWNLGDLSFEQLGGRPGGGGRPRPRRPSRLRCWASRRGPRLSIAYAVRHPERVSRLILYGGYARGWATPGDQPRRARIPRHHRAGARRVGQGQPGVPPGVHVAVHPRRRPTSRSRWFNELCRKTARPRMPATLLEMRARRSTSYRCSTRCVCRRSSCTGAATRWCRSRRAASSPPGIPGRAVRRARLGATTSCSRVSRRGGASARRCWTSWGCAAPREAGDAAFDALSPREREILALLTEGLGNAEIAERLSISEKTVRNHVSQPLRQAGRVDARPGHRVRPRPRVQE